jgi:hypothetical protein
MDEYAKNKDSDKATAPAGGDRVCRQRLQPELLAQAWMYIGLVRGNGARTGTPRAKPSRWRSASTTSAARSALLLPTAQALFDGIKGQRASEDPAKVVPRFEAGTQMGCWPLVQEVETFRPIPLACSTRVQGVSAVVLRYRAYGDDNWTRVDLKKKGEEWRGRDPVHAARAPGTWGMYIEAKDERDNPLERLGSRDRPLVFKVVEKSTQPPPSLPGEPRRIAASRPRTAPKRWSARPPVMPCRGPGQEGHQLQSVQRLRPGHGMRRGQLQGPGVCTKDADCGEGMMCQAGSCAGQARAAASATGSASTSAADFASLSQATDVCRTGADEYACYATGVPTGHALSGTAAPVTGGMHLGTLRALFSYDRFLTDNISLGVRFGFAFSGAPDGFFPLHFEGRGTYYFGDVIRGRSRFVPYMAMGAGVGAGRYARAGGDGGLAARPRRRGMPAHPRTEVLQSTEVNRGL